MDTKSTHTTTNSNSKTDTVLCHKCKSEVKMRDCIICCKCDKPYEFDCAGFSEKLYRMMEPKNKRAWKCKSCINVGKNGPPKLGSSKGILTTTTPSTANVTMRRFKPVLTKESKTKNILPTEKTSSTPKINETQITNIPVHNSFESLLTDNDDSLCTDIEEGDGLHSNIQCNRSFPDLNTNLHIFEELEQAKATSALLQEKLEVAENEIAIQLSENYTLKNKITKYERKIEMLSRLCASVPSVKKQCNKKNIPNNYSASKLESLNKIKRSFKDRSFHELNVEQSPISFNTDITNLRGYVNEITDLNKKIDLLQSYLTAANNKIVELESEINYEMFLADRDELDPTQVSNSRLQDAGPVYTPKICLISSNSRDILLMSERYFDNSNRLHYKITNGGVIKLIENLESKLKNYTLKDYCIIFIGKTDFEITMDYDKLVDYIKTTLNGVQHTNVILCLPSFICNNQATLYNKRIEVFNKKIYMDNVKHKYACVLDSNKNLEYSSSMFSTTTGKINKNGMATIFLDLKRLITRIEGYTHPASAIYKFFRGPR